MSDAPDDRTTDALSAERKDSLVPVLLEAQGPQETLRKRWAQGTLVLGSGAGCDWVLPDPAISRRHVALELLPEQVLVRDLGSRNGTRYLGARVSVIRLPLGSTVRIGRTTLRFLVDDAEAERRASAAPHGLVWISAAMSRVRVEVERLAALDVPVLVSGETGVGKGAVARAIHTLSARASGPWVVVDCGALQENLAASELFGHAEGAFTGAIGAREGMVERAHKGTLFLDEVGELPLSMQSLLLRLVETREYRRVGEWEVRPSDFRIIAATHRSLAEEVKRGRFRAPLYHRLAVAEIAVPPLRERLEDIPVLARHFAARAPGAVRLDPTTVSALQSTAWPGNVRELRNAVERLAVLSTGHSKSGSEPQSSFIEARDHVLERFEREFLRALLERHGGNASAAAREAKLARSHFYRLLERHGLVPKRE